MKCALVLTSIHDCTNLLKDYLANFAKFGHEPKIYLIPDQKTPKQELPNGVHIPPIAGQRDFLKRIGFGIDNVPMNSDNRRNVGYLMALVDGAEVIISIDDDNYCVAGLDFIGEHSAGLNQKGDLGTWYNNCELIDAPLRVYPRGFPHFARNVTQQVVINAGMWAEDPDCDAITWLHMPTKSTRSSFIDAILPKHTWCPINSQNTALTRAMMVAYWFVRMDAPMDRFGDIFQGYFALKVAKHFGWTARFGSPIVEHRRNSHNYLKDAAAELPAMMVLEEFLPKLLEYKLTGTTVYEAYCSLADFVASQDTPFFSETARLMRLWSETCRRIG